MKWFSLILKQDLVHIRLALTKGTVWSRRGKCHWAKVDNHDRKNCGGIVNSVEILPH